MTNMQPPFASTPDPQIAQLKLPPHSIEAEQSVLGGLMLDNEAWTRISDLVNDAEFYHSGHKLVYYSIGRLIERNQPADVITVAEELDRLGKLEDAGGLNYLGQLVETTPSAANIRRYAEIVHERYVLRELARVGNEIADSAYNPEGRQADELLDTAEAAVFKIAESGNSQKQGFLDTQTLLTQVVERIDELYHRDTDSDVTGVATGFIDLDNKTSGLQPGDLIIVAGRPSMGKTAFAVNVGENVATQSGKPVAIFSMEMGGAQLVMRMIGSVGRLDQHKLRTGKLEDDDWPKLTHAVGKLHEAPIFIDETGGLSVTELRARCRRLMRDLAIKGINDGKLGLIVIDYLQLMKGSTKSATENRATEISEISRSLKSLAKELEVPVVALSQLSRAVEQRPDKRPMMSDLRESGAIEQDADVILFMYREEYYFPDKEEIKGTGEVIIGKQRNGPVGRVRLTWLGKYTRFESFAGGGFIEDDN
ncbi:replicative DNA helicase [Leeia sp. TBRC 13508]|uniref:Replicative DNA helicase n=1 Tax=Leeia speluncae TaxID=2884804 RepID=A0ABS8D2L7_9NEIS|nr:replicative DNA helicase [Leeia speluncae]MCB6182412.1 replicative DNA helicase [Leeia speluncae]